MRGTIGDEIREARKDVVHNISLELSLDRPLGRLALLLGETAIDNVPASGGVNQLLRPTQLNSIVRLLDSDRNTMRRGE